MRSFDCFNVVRYKPCKLVAIRVLSLSPSNCRRQMITGNRWFVSAELAKTSECFQSRSERIVSFQCHMLEPNWRKRKKKKRKKLRTAANRYFVPYEFASSLNYFYYCRPLSQTSNLEPRSSNLVSRLETCQAMLCQTIRLNRRQFCSNDTEKERRQEQLNCVAAANGENGTPLHVSNPTI